MDISFMDFNDFFEKNSREVKVNTPYGTVIIPKERNLDNALKNRYKVFAEFAVVAFKESLEKYDNCDDLADNGEKDFQQSIVPAMEDLKSAYVSLEEYDKDYSSIFQMAVDLDLLAPFDEAFGNFLEYAGAIVDDLESEKNYREYRKDNRSQWVGGTIGGNAISAMNTQMEIGAMNAASGVAHGIVNAAGNLISEMQAEEKLNKLFSNEKMRNSIIQGVYDSVMNLRFLLIRSVGEETYFATVSKADEEKAQRIVNNLKSGIISEEKQIDVFNEVIDCDPYNDDFYKFLFDKYGDDGALNELATYFGVDCLSEYKSELALEYIKENQGETEDDAHKAKELLKEYLKSINLDYDENLSSVVYINDLLADFDKKYRTVDEVEHETREDADLSREELPAIQEFMANVEPPKGEPLLPYERHLIKQKEEFECKFSSEVAKKYLKTIEKYIDNFEKSFLAVGFFGASNRDEAAKKRALKYAKGLKYTTVEEFNNQYAIFCSFIEENLGVNIEEATEAKSYLDKKKEKLVNGGSLDLSNIGKGLKGLFGKK